jgi:hypothetical protein
MEMCLGYADNLILHDRYQHDPNACRGNRFWRPACSAASVTDLVNMPQVVQGRHSYLHV